MILFALICFAAYWAWQYYKGTQKAKKDKEKKEEVDAAGDPDVLEAYYKRKIAEMEDDSVKNLEYAQEQLKYYKEKLEKLNNLKK